MTTRQLTFKLKVVIIDIYDFNGNNLDIDTCCDNVRDYKSLKDIYNVNCSYYSWRITDNELLGRIKNAGKGEMFKSEIFEMNKMEWYFMLYPNGENVDDDSGELRLKINLKEMPKDVKGVTFHFELFIKETGTRYSNFSHFIGDYLTKGWKGCYLKIQEIQDLKQITFQIKLSIMDVFDYNDDSILQQYI